ncbi:pilus assembly protein [Thermodesulfobacteriota bacterium]
MFKMKVLAFIALFILFLMVQGQVRAACPEPSMADYTAYPVFQSNAVEPNILIVLDNSGSMNSGAYSADYDHNTRYYGYFEPYKKYTYSSNVFYRDTSGDWDGNYLNWVTMRRVDVVRKVLMGGLATSRTGGGNQTNIGEDPSGWGYVHPGSYETDTWGVTPNQNTDFFHYVYDGKFTYWYHDGAAWIYVDEYTIKVRKGKDINGVHLSDEDYNFLEGNIAGIMQRLWSKARFGLEFFNEGSDDGSNRNGGIIPRVVGSSMTDMINSIQNKACDTWTPLAEAYYTAIQYFKQEDVEAALDYANNVIPNTTAAQDPYNNPDPVHCAKSFVLLLTDGASSKDLYIPDFLKDYDNDGNDGITVVDSGTTNDGKLVATAGSDTVKTFYLNYTNPYPSGTTPFNDASVGSYLVLFDSNDRQIYYEEITAVNYYGGDTSGTSEIVVSGTTNSAEWKSGASPYTYNLSWKIVNTVPNDETGINAGSDYLDDLALYARTTDLRADLQGNQNLILYTVYAFGADATARNLLKDSSKQGGFIDKNGNSRPDLASEWDANSDGDPDTYYEASSGYLLESKLLAAINDILKRAAAGTAVSVLATSGEGEGNLVQAYFRPSVTSGTTEVRWVGHLQSLWADAYGNLREDTDGDLALDVTTDKVVTYFLDEADGDTKIRRYTVSGASPYPDLVNGAYEVLPLNAISPLWEAGSRLAQKNADDRMIFTYVDKDQDGVVDESTNDPFDDIGEAIRFHTSGVSAIIPYLGVRDDATWDYLGAAHSDRALNVIEYIRGKDSGFSGTTTMNIRTRTIDGNVWKLADIVHSTPVSVSKPPDNYHIIYSDVSYLNYLSGVSNRETMVYVGGNDGMLHAFTSWKYDSASMQYTIPVVAPGAENIGDELWAYIPQALLPHLKWLPSTDYTHTYYMDLKPKIFDAKILPDDTHYTDSDGDDNWGTILLAGMNMGGKQICSEDTFDNGSGGSIYETRTFYPSYVAIDVTDPRNPRLLWERTYQDLGMSASIPAVIRVQDKWFAVFGSGPTNYDGESNQEARVYVVDLKTGDSYPNLSTFSSGTTNAWLFEGNESDAFMNSPVSLDKELNNNVDAVYFGETYYSGGGWKGKIYKIAIPWDWTDTTSYIDDPNDAADPWTFSTFFNATRPITAPVALSVDTFDNTWVYFGSGRYLGQDDKTNTDTQYLFGIVDPFFNRFYDTAPDDYYHDYSKSLELSMNDLLDADPYVVTTEGKVYDGASYFGTWDDLLDDARAEDGWKRTLTTNMERALTKFTILGGIAFAPSFVPNEDVCGFGGESYLYGLYYETGTPYYKAVFSDGTEIVTLEGEDKTKVLGKISLGAGKSSALGIHVGQEEGAKAFVQQSTGTVIQTDVEPAFNIKSAIIDWREN